MAVQSYSVSVKLKMISCVGWVPRGAAKAVPEVVQPSAEELEAFRQQLEAQEDDESSEQSDSEDGDSSDEDMDDKTAIERARAAAAAITSRSGGAGGASVKTEGLEAAMRELDMDHYDDSDDDNVVARAMGGRIEMVGDDPYITLEDDDDDSEIEDLEIKPTDLVILAARNEDDVNSLEVWIYEEAATPEEEANVYVHHEIMLPAFPLCLAWLDCHPSGSTDKANLVAVGTMEPSIEIWDLDTMEGAEPVAVLGGEDKDAAAAAAAARAGLDKNKKKVSMPGMDATAKPHAP